MRRVVILSAGGDFAHALLDELERRGTQAAALVLYVPSTGEYWRRLGSARARLRALPLLPARWAAWRLRPRLDARFRRAAPRVVVTGVLNGGRMERQLRRLAPDVLVLARCGVLQPRILAIPREGVVAVHPGLLPWIRGNGPFDHSILREVPLGCSSFRVEAGIDTGPVLERRLVRVQGGERIRALREAQRRLWVEMTASLVTAAAAGPLPPGTPQEERWPLYRAVRDRDTLDRISAALAAGAARTLFDRWAPLADPRDLSLPPSVTAPPPHATPLVARPADAISDAADETPALPR